MSVKLLKVALKKVCLRPSLPKGAVVDVFWVSAKNINGGHDIQFLWQGHSAETSWDEVKHPKQCVAVQLMKRDGFGRCMGNYGEGMKMDFVYCATNNDFVGIEPDRADVTSCPLCGKHLQ